MLITLEQIMDKCSNWEQFCEEKGFSVYAVSEGGGDITVELTTQEAQRFGIIKYSENNAMEWQPIGTAPDDQVFLMAQPDDLAEDCWHIRVGYKSKTYLDFVALGCSDFKPTHWMPLPEPPSAKS